MLCAVDVFSRSIYCVKMKNTTFKDKDVEKYLAKNFVVLKIDVDDKKFKNIKEKFKVKTLPSFLIIDKNEDVIKKSSGYMGSKEFLNWLDNQIFENSGLI